MRKKEEKMINVWAHSMINKNETNTQIDRSTNNATTRLGGSDSVTKRVDQEKQKAISVFYQRTL